MSALTDRIAKVLRDEANEVVFGESNEEAWRRLAERVVAVVPSTGELQMHYGEAVEWIAALHKWIERRGLTVPEWSDVDS